MSLIQRNTTTFDAEGNVQKMEIMVVNRVPKEPDFVKFYSNNIHLLNGLYIKDRQILDRLISLMGYDSIINLNSGIKKEICFEVELFRMDGRGRGHTIKRDKDDNPIPSLDGFDRCISRLQQRLILIRMSHSQYMVNPFLYAKGLWSDVKKLQQKVSHLFNISGDDKV